MNTKPVLLVAVALLTLSTLQGCFYLAAGAAVTSVVVAEDRRSVGRFVDDNVVDLEIKNKIFNNKDLREQTHIEAMSVNGIVLLTGEAPTTALRDEVLRLVRSVSQVRQVVNEIEIAGKSSLASRANDSWLYSKIKTKLVSTQGISDATRIKVHVSKSVVYLMGLVTHAEASAATNAARTVGGVQRVVKVFEYVD
jgi:osmotically-inducible protein OsmY